MSYDVEISTSIAGMHITAHLHRGTLKDTVNPDDGRDWAKTCRLILTRIYILYIN